MKKNYLFKFGLFMIPFTAFILIANSSGRDDARSGSPGDGGATCASCHTGGSAGASLAITTNIPTTGYDTNTAYTVTVNNSSSASAHGFQLVAEQTSNDAKVGGFTAGTGSRVSGDRITHSNSSQNSWSFTWTSPATDVGAIKFYAASVAANGNGSTSGDQVVTSSSGNINALGISKANRLEFKMFPNPASNFVNIQLVSENETAKVDFYNVVGQLVYSKNVTLSNRQIDISSLNSGIYTMRVQTDSKIGVKQLIKN